MELPPKINKFLQNCENCGRCERVCPFLETYGPPDKIISETPEKVFLCSNCGACDMVCKVNLQPSEMLFEMKQMLLKNGSITVEVGNAIKSAENFTMRGHRFPFSHYASADIVFWPGCSISGTSPELVKKTVQLLSNHLKKKVGLVLDCCFDPLYQLGDVDPVKEAAERIHSRLEKHKINHLITGCTNCRKTLSQYLPDRKVEHILEVLPEKVTNPSFLNNPSISSFVKRGGGEFYLHHPCPSFRVDAIIERIKTMLQSTNNENSRPSCCGNGGGISSLSPELSGKFTDKVVKSSKGNPVITYCMGCKGKFLRKGQKAYHVLEILTSVKPIEKPVSSGKKWVNRFFLASGQKFNIKKLISAQRDI